MSAFNVVRLKVKPEREKEFLEIHRTSDRSYPGFRRGVLVKTGERAYCYIGEWNDFDNIVAARPRMIEYLDSFRPTLEDLGGDLGVTDAISGEVVLELKH